jgi:oligoendopeptidase F
MNSIRPLRPLTCLQPGEGGGGGDMADLPEWDFSALYAGQDDPKIASDLNWLAEEAKRFRADYEGQLSDKTAIALGTCIQRYEGMQSVMGRIMSFAGLRYYQNTTDANRAKFMSDMQDKITTISSDLVFFSLEMNRIEDERFDLLVSQDETLTRYKPVLDRMRAMKPYQLSDELETFLHDQSVVAVLLGQGLERR